MVTISASSSISLLARAALVHNQPSLGASSSLALGSPKISIRGRVRCSAEARPDVKKQAESRIGFAAVAAAAAEAVSSPAAMALVDDRMSTEGTGLPFGLSNNLLGWILFGMFGLIWTLYFTYASSLDEDEDSGLSL